MDVLKWYSIILISLGILSNLYLCIRDKNKIELLSFILLIPILLYLILA